MRKERLSGYQYSKNDLLKNPQRYQKTPFVGIEFLKLYQRERERILTLCNETDFSLTEYIKKLNADKPMTEKIILEDYLHYLLYQTTVKQNFLKKEIDRLLKKFEIRKLLFTEYNSEFKETSNNYHNLKNYILLSLLCIIQYQSSFSLRYLNTCLKLNDTIISQIDNVSKSDKSVFAYVVKKELECIKSLCKKKEIHI